MPWQNLEEEILEEFCSVATAAPKLVPKKKVGNSVKLDGFKIIRRGGKTLSPEELKAKEDKKEATRQRRLAYTRAWNLLHRDEVLEKRRRYHQEHRDEILARKAAKRRQKGLSNPKPMKTPEERLEAKKAARKAWGQANRDKLREAWHRCNSSPEAKAKRAAREKARWEAYSPVERELHLARRRLRDKQRRALAKNASKTEATETSRQATTGISGDGTTDNLSNSEWLRGAAE